MQRRRVVRYETIAGEPYAILECGHPWPPWPSWAPLSALRACPECDPPPLEEGIATPHEAAMEQRAEDRIAMRQERLSGPRLERDDDVHER